MLAGVRLGSGLSRVLVGRPLCTVVAVQSAQSIDTASLSLAKAPPAPVVSHRVQNVPAIDLERDAEGHIVLPIVSLSGQPTGQKISLNSAVFDQPLRVDILHRVVTWQRARWREGSAVTKRRSELRGSGKKLRPQKRSGRARMRDGKAPQFRGGYKPHGPVKRSFEFRLNKKVRALGLRVALSNKVHYGQVMVVDSLNVDQTERLTNFMVRRIDDLGLTADTTLFIDDAFAKRFETKVGLGIHNIRGKHGLPPLGANVFDVLRYKRLVLTPESVVALTARLHPEARYGWTPEPFLRNTTLPSDEGEEPEALA